MNISKFSFKLRLYQIDLSQKIIKLQTLYPGSVLSGNVLNCYYNTKDLKKNITKRTFKGAFLSFRQIISNIQFEPFSAATLTGQVLLVCTAGLTGKYIFLALALGFVSAYALLKMTISQETMANEEALNEGKDGINMESHESKLRQN